MPDSSNPRTARRMGWFMIWFAIAAVGGFVDYLGWYQFHSRTMAMVGFFAGAGGVVLGAISVVLFQVKAVADRLNDDG
jgi:hypothetical protein